MAGDTDQAAPAESVSLEDRIGAKFGQANEPGPEEQTPTPEADAIPEADAEPVSDIAEVEWDGEKYQVPQKLKEAIIHASDYTKKTQAIAQERKAMDVERQSIRAAQIDRDFMSAVADELKQLHEVDATIAQYGRLDWQSLPTDDIIRHRMALDQQKDKRQGIVSQIEGKRGEFAQKQDVAKRELIAKGDEYLRSAIPAWGEAEAKEVRDYALKQGYTAEELENVYNPRYVHTLWQAKQYAKLQAQAKSKPVTAPTVKTTAVQTQNKAKAERLNYFKAIKNETDPNERRKIVEARVGKIFGG